MTHRVINQRAIDYSGTRAPSSYVFAALSVTVVLPAARRADALLQQLLASRILTSSGYRSDRTDDFVVDGEN